jgi:hemoglobin
MSLYEQLGGDPAISAALDRFYGKVLADPTVSVYFERVDVERVKAAQRAFLAMAFGGPNNYGGRDLRTAHAATRARGLDEKDYEAFMTHFRDTLVELGVAEPQIAEVMAIADTGKDDVLGR